MLNNDNQSCQPFLYLASSSPRRKEILNGIGIKFEILNQAIDETRLTDESASAYVMRLAQNKAQAGRNCLSEENSKPVLGADTIVVSQGEILGKPIDFLDASRMLNLLSGQWHEVMTAIAMTNGLIHKSLISTTRVKFKALSPEEIQAYWKTGEPNDKAGAYAVQGKGGMFVEGLEGSYSGVVGLPVFETVQLLEFYGFKTSQVLENDL